MLVRCSVDDLLLVSLEASALSATVMTGGQCCRHGGTATAACTAQVPELTTQNSTVDLCVRLWSAFKMSLPNQTNQPLQHVAGSFN